MQQRLGETDKEFEARKKRVMRTRRGVGYGLAHGGGSLIYKTNTCVTTSKTDGTWTGFSVDLVGSVISPTHTKDGTLIYAFKFDNLSNFVIQFGTLGNEQLVGINEILVTYGNLKGIAIWNATNLRYEFIDVDMATALKSLPSFCLNMEVLPSLVLSYTFAEVSTGVA